MKYLNTCYVNVVRLYGGDIEELSRKFEQKMQKKKDDHLVDAKREPKKRKMSDSEEEEKPKYKPKRTDAAPRDKRRASKINYAKLAEGDENTTDEDEYVASTKKPAHKKPKLSIEDSGALSSLDLVRKYVLGNTIIESDVNHVCTRHRIVSRKVDCDDSCVMRRYRTIFSGSVSCLIER